MSKEGPKPISPREVIEQKQKSIPDAVIESFNELILENEQGGQSTIFQDDAVARMVEKGLDRSEIYKKGWLDIEGMYRKAGWQVEYDKPGYNESYRAHFIFRRAREK